MSGTLILIIAFRLCQILDSRENFVLYSFVVEAGPQKGKAAPLS